MLRKPVAIRIDELIEAGIHVFTAKGYRNTRLEDVAAELRVSAPALYNYVEGKDALFDLVVRRAIFPNVELAAGDFPVKSPAPGATIAFIAEFASQKAVLPALERALGRPQRNRATAAELRDILGELFETLAYFRRGIRLVERCAEEWPELRAAWFGGGRNEFHDALCRYCANRQKKKRLWAEIEPHHAAKLMIETCAFFAIHRHYDPRPVSMTPEAAKTTAVESMVRAFCPQPVGREGKR